MTGFAYNIFKNVNTGHMPFELNCSYQLWILYTKNVNFLKLANKLLAILRKLMIVCQKNLYYAQKFHK